ncbi:putative secreted protein [Corynebacterium kutscheri]|uniref:Secreted protein n=1 Tax=Corynebacterium kutscheri TaxID=35755 RepID=A0A0F6QYZ0_9CORY|nr:TlpA disulfide reductase family protein [Corynebacterium kutscheri]AKE40415.1 thiol-disulfide isomerase-like thioredoxin [Corynebacterium kutscheri]VEH05249.1 putative secreted protein [Corynebacterium kutscheri]VEH10810.1 putative secreted protein [Corynebacterium kutscheri]VEH80711.1 putative secreted protein [Corynebacterium kutscheri]
MRKTLLFSTLGFLVILAIFAALLLPTKATDETVAQPTEIADRPDCPGETLAAVALDCLGGKKVASGKKYSVVTLWAWWCQPCRAELPLFDELAQHHPELNVVGVHADPSASQAAALLTDLGLHLPSYQDNDNSFAGMLGLPAVVPITIIVDPEGKVVTFIPRVFDTYDQLETTVLEAIV